MSLKALRWPALLIWLLALSVFVAPLLIAALSPLHAGRQIAYVVAALAGVLALGLLLLQALLAARLLPALPWAKARRWHRWLGSALALAIALHVGGLYLSSPADVIDALLLRAPTLFSLYGVIALWAALLLALVAAMRLRLPLSYGKWRIVHSSLAVIVVLTTVPHALLIEGTMGLLSKWLLSIAVLLATAAVCLRLWWRTGRTRH